MKKSLLKLFSFISVLLFGCGSEQPFEGSLIAGLRILVRNINEFKSSHILA